VIAKMKKVFLVARGSEREALLEKLRDLGVVHLEPVDPAAAAPEELQAKLSGFRRALQVLRGIKPADDRPEVGAGGAVEEILVIVRRAEENRNRLLALGREAERLTIWGNVRREQIDALEEAAVPVSFYSVPTKRVAETSAECVALLGELPGKRTLVAAVQRVGEPTLPDGARLLELPARDLPAVRAEAKEVDASLAEDAERLSHLANLADLVDEHCRRLAGEVQFAAALAGAMQGEDLFAVQGWAPRESADGLGAEVVGAGMEAAVQSLEPTPEEEPPTLIRYPRWARPIRGLFRMLGTVAGYRESDVSIAFMIALPIFAAMLIGDGGYGAVFLLGPVVFWKKLSKILGAEFTRLLMVIGAVALIWGLLNASFFGVVLYRPVIPVNMTDASRNLVMRISFYVGAVHLAVAQLWRGILLWPSLKSLSKFGWAIFVWGMLGVVSYFVLNESMSMATPWPYLLMGGAALAILFAHPSRNPIKMIGLGLASFPLSMLSAFSDVISYVRLMAVGLASGVLASSFNGLALSAGPWIIAVPILILGHGLNLGLALIALFAHGVRLNMLEFSNNLGMQWTGRQYQPFAKPVPEEIQT
jgi:V/A-type H+-transporting ATPase subunit I